MTERREVLVNALVIYLSVCLVFVGLETALALEVLTSDANYPKYEWCRGPENAGVFHPRYGATRHPNQQYLVKQSSDGEWNIHTINSEGFRDTYNSGDGNIIVLGDSFTEGLSADDNSTYPHLLDRWTPNVSFRNYGRGGYGTAIELLVYEDVAEEYNHSVVILGYYLFNDMQNNVDNDSQRPQFEVRNGSLVLSRLPKESDKPEVAPGPIQSGPLATVKTFLIRNTHSYLYVAPKIGALLEAVGIVKQEQSGPPSGRELARQTQVTKLLLTRLAEEAARNDATLLIVGIPERGEVNPNNPHFYKHKDAERYADHQRQMIERVVSDNQNTHYLDLKPALVAEYDRGNRVYGIGDAHMNEYGYRVTAKAIYQWLVEQDKIDRDPTINLSTEHDRVLTACP